MRLKYLLHILASLAVLFSCDRLESVNQGDDTLISLQGELETSTKASTYRKGMIEDIDDLKEWKFGATIYGANNKPVNNDLKKGISFMWKGSEWGYSNNEAYYWSKCQQPLDIYAYYPLVGVSASDTKFQTNYNPEGAVMTLTNWVDGIDVLYARSTGRYKEASTPLYFKHAFSKIEQINFRIPSDSKLTFDISEVEITATHCETDGKLILRKEGELEYQSGATQISRSKTLSPSMVVTKNHTDGVILMQSTDNWFIFPVSTTSIWDGTNPSNVSDVTLSKTCIHLKAKVKQGNEMVLGSESEYADIYLPIKGSSNSSQALDRAKRYTINLYLKKGVGYNKDGVAYKPIDFEVSVDTWVENEVTVGQITVKPSSVILNSANNYSADVVVNAGHTDLSLLSTSPSSNLNASLRVEEGKVYATITRNGTPSAGSGSVIINDQASNSMATISVNIQ